MIRVLVADDHTLFRQGLIGLMETREDLIQVVGEAATGREAVELAERLRPDVVLMDIFMPDGNGLEATAAIRARLPNTQVVMLTSSESDAHLYQAVHLGASGYLLKSLDTERVFELLAGLMRGEVAMTPEMASRLLKGIAKRSTDTDKGEEPLTERELIVLRLVATGASNQDIADQLCLSVHTVKTHIRNILDKLQLENRTQAANYAMDRGLVTPTVNQVNGQK
jgi:NarL family two-component system response regulator LiaR